MKKNNKKGFTLIEMVVVIAIIGILISVLVPSLVGYIKKSKISADKNDALANYATYKSNCANSGKNPGDEFIYKGETGLYVVSNGGRNVEKYTGDKNPTDVSTCEGGVEYNKKDDQGGNQGGNGGSVTDVNKEYQKINGIYKYSFSENYESLFNIETIDSLGVTGKMTLKKGTVYSGLSALSTTTEAVDQLFKYNAYYEDNNVTNIPMVNKAATDIFKLTSYDDQNNLESSVYSLQVGTKANPSSKLVLTSMANYEKINYVVVKLGSCVSDDITDTVTVSATVQDTLKEGKSEKIDLGTINYSNAGTFTKIMFDSGTELKGKLELTFERENTNEGKFPFFIQSIWISSIPYVPASAEGGNDDKPTEEEIKTSVEQIKNLHKKEIGTEVKNVVGKVTFIDSKIGGGLNRFYIQVGDVGYPVEITDNSDFIPCVNQVVEISGIKEKGEFSANSIDFLLNGGTQIKNTDLVYKGVDRKNEICPIYEKDLTNIDTAELKDENQYVLAKADNLKIIKTNFDKFSISNTLLQYIELVCENSAGKTITICSQAPALGNKKSIVTSFKPGNFINVSNAILYKCNESGVGDFIQTQSGWKLKANNCTAFELVSQ